MKRVLDALISASLLIAALALPGSTPASADETCMSPYMAKIVGQEDFIYIWTLGMKGVGDEQDKLVTVAVNPSSAEYGKVVHTLSVGGRNEAHHSGLTDDRHFLWAGGLDTNKIFVFDVHTDPAKPALAKTIDTFVTDSGGIVGPHTMYALPGRMMITGLSNNKDHGGRTALVEYTNDGKYVATHWMPTDDDLHGAAKSGSFADGYGYDVRALPRRNVLVTSSFTGWNNYMMNLGKLMADAEAMKRFGNTVVVWDLHTRKPKKVLDVPGAPLEIRCAWGAQHDYCFTATALTSKLWLIYEDGGGEWKAEAIADIGDASKIPLPVDISITADDSLLVGGHLERRQGEALRRLEPARGEADLREGDRQPGQHGVGELGRETRLLHLLAARQLGQDRVEGRRCAVSQGVRVGRQSAEGEVRHRLHRRQARRPAPDALRGEQHLKAGC